MSLISVTRDELTLGLSLPWALFDQDRHVLVEKGQTIETDAQLQALLASKPLRELSWDSSVSRTAPEQPDAAENNPEEALAHTLDSSFTFADMRLHAGDRIQVQPPAALGAERYIVKLIGYLEKASLLVTAPTSNGLRVPLRESDKIVVRVFTSQKAFSFDCTVERVCKIPYDYLHLSFPEVIQGTLIRRSPRIRTKIIASIARLDAADGSERQSGMIVNLSADGALLNTRLPLYEKSQVILLSFRINLHNVDAYLTTKAIVRNVFTDEIKDKDEVLKYHHGLQFLDLQPNDSVILQSLIYQQMIELPHCLA